MKYFDSKLSYIGFMCQNDPKSAKDTWSGLDTNPHHATFLE